MTVHPALVLILGALLVPFFKGTLRNTDLLMGRRLVFKEWETLIS